MHQASLITMGNCLKKDFLTELKRVSNFIKKKGCNKIEVMGKEIVSKVV